LPMNAQQQHSMRMNAQQQHSMRMNAQPHTGGRGDICQPMAPRQWHAAASDRTMLSGVATQVM
jgi:hypothetical protein